MGVGIVILLDTHAWIWYATESKELPDGTRRSIERSDDIGISVMSCWETAMLVARGRLAFGMEIGEWIELALSRPKVRLLPLDPKSAVLSTRLPGDFHGDPVDRMIVATALTCHARLVTKDRRITEWGYVPVIW